MEPHRIAAALEILAASESSQDVEAQRIVEMARMLDSGAFDVRASWLATIEREKGKAAQASIDAWQRTADSSIVMVIEKAQRVIAKVRSW